MKIFVGQSNSENPPAGKHQMRMTRFAKEKIETSLAGRYEAGIILTPNLGCHLRNCRILHILVLVLRKVSAVTYLPAVNGQSNPFVPCNDCSTPFHVRNGGSGLTRAHTPPLRSLVLAWHLAFDMGMGSNVSQQKGLFVRFFIH